MVYRILTALALCFLCASCQGLNHVKKAHIPKGEYVPFFDQKKESVAVDAFDLDVYPVTQAQYLQFVKHNPAWSRSRVKSVFADEDYLKNWKADDKVQAPDAPVTYVSWFAAKSYCKWKNERLPTLNEWEFAARAGEKSSDGSDGDGNQRRVLDWYSKPGQGPLSRVGKSRANYYGVFDLHGLIWEWVFDFNSVPQSDGRASSSEYPENLFCAGGAQSAADPSDYAAFMRFAFRSSLKGSYTIKDLGFRCAKENS